MKKNTWLIVANSSIARIYRLENKHSLVEIEVLEHPESRLHNLEIVSDKPGRDSNRVGWGRHAVSTRGTPKEHECTVFVNKIASYLEAARKKQEFEKLYITASPTILGLIRQELSPSTAKLIQGEADKDMTQMKPEEILAHLPFPTYAA